MQQALPRRQFLKATGAALGTAAGFFGGIAGAAPATFGIRTGGKAQASERVRLGFIACGGRARWLIGIFNSFEDVEVAALCDVNEPRMEEAQQPLQNRADRTIDYREILERDDIDAVVIATTEHWHAAPFLEACRARKPIFIEKPLSHTVEEGRRMVNAAREAGVLAMMGTQQRAGEHYKRAVEIVQSGRLGNIGLVSCWNYMNRGGFGHPEDQSPPPGLHWNQWLGPAPLVEYNPARLVYSWWFDYGGGMMTNWAVHHIDVVLWAMQAESPTSVSCSGGRYVIDDVSDTPDTIEASWEFPDFLMQYSYRGMSNFHTVMPRPHHHGIAFYGNQATLILDREGYQLYAEDDPSHPVEESGHTPQDGPWQRTFIDCVKNGDDPPMDFELSHKATVCCLLGNISYRTGRTIEWDGGNEQILGDDEAAAMLGKEYRPGFELPE